MKRIVVDGHFVGHPTLDKFADLGKWLVRHSLPFFLTVFTVIVLVLISLIWSNSCGEYQGHGASDSVTQEENLPGE